VGPTTTNPPQIACPADVTVTGVAAASQAVLYPTPTVTDGLAPVTTTCSPVSGASFPLGATTVSCAANDAMARQAACSFTVRLTGMSIAAKKFSAIGDSITIGENGERLFVDTPNAYPTRLQVALETTYPGQGIVVANHGDGGKRMDAILSNLLKYVTAEKPDAVLLEGGYNDLLGECGNGPTNTGRCREAIQSAVPIGFRDLIRKSKEAPRSVQYVFVMTLTPPGPVEKGAREDKRISNDAIVQTNARIRQVAAAEGAVLVDVYPLFQGHEAEYVDVDGLHIRPAGYQVIANAFFSAIQQTIAQTPLFGFTAPR
jgi:lysophospholipase L1-like esterase